MYLPSGLKANHKQKRKYYINELIKEIKPINLNRNHVILTGDFNFVLDQIDQGCQTYGPREHFMWPAGTFRGWKKCQSRAGVSNLRPQKASNAALERLTIF